MLALDAPDGVNPILVAFGILIYTLFYMNITVMLLESSVEKTLKRASHYS